MDIETVYRVKFKYKNGTDEPIGIVLERIRKMSAKI